MASFNAVCSVLWYSVLSMLPLSLKHILLESYFLEIAWPLKRGAF